MPVSAPSDPARPSRTTTPAIAKSSARSATDVLGFPCRSCGEDSISADLARQLIDRPGVHVAAGMSEAMDVVDQILETYAMVDDALRNPAPV